MDKWWQRIHFVVGWDCVLVFTHARIAEAWVKIKEFQIVGISDWVMFEADNFGCKSECGNFKTGDSSVWSFESEKDPVDH